MTDQPVIARKQGAAGWLTLNAPKSLHSLTHDMCRIMTEALLAWQHDDTVKWIVIDHLEGTRGFCAGGDIRMLAASGAKDGEEGRAFFAAEYRLNTLLHRYQKPVIALQDGITMGGGVGISVHGPYRVATENTVFAMPESGIGLFPDVGGGWFLPRLEGELGMWLALTGARLKGKDVLAVGVATHYVPSDTLAGLKERLATDGPAALAGAQTSAEGSFAPHLATIDACFAKDSVEEIVAALKAQASDWALAQADTLAQKSPTTLKVAHRQLRAGKSFEKFEDNMRMEFRIGSRLITSHDFLEGVRATIIEKDNAPKWSPAQLSDVTDAELDRIFAPLGDKELTFID